MEFEFKIIGVEKGTHSLTSEKGEKWDVDALLDAPNILESTPKKRVIELPADVIEGIQNAKTYWENVAGFVLNAPSIVFPEIRKSIGEPKASYDKVADILGSWYFGNIEFIVKKESKFVVEVDRHEYIYASFIGSAIGKKTVEFWKIPQEVTEEEADELVACLTALNARKVKVEE